MIFQFLLLLTFVIVAVIVAYGLCLLTFAITNYFKTAKSPYSLKKEYQTIVDVSASIDVFVASFDEGEGLLKTIKSIESQTYKGKKNLFVLLNDRHDSSVTFLQEKYGMDLDNISLSNNLSLKVLFTNKQSKTQKLNAHISQSSSHYIGILDADHIASEKWLAHSVVTLKNSPKNIVGVQSRRTPKAALNFFQLWDSSQNHAGNEFFNIGLDGFKQSAFFTGTTAVFNAEVFKKFQFSDCITEDTYLSYQLLLDGKKIAYNIETGSEEDTPPTIQDYIARRRRWSNGHNKTFFTFFLKIVASKQLKIFSKATIAFHGLFFFMPVLALVLINIYQLFIFWQLPTTVRGGSVAITLLLTILIVYFINNKRKIHVGDLFITYAWVMPIITVGTLFTAKLLEWRFYHSIISFPYVSTWFKDIQTWVLFIPLAVLLIAFRRIRIFNFKQVLTIIFSYPLMIVTDIYAINLGFFDYLLGDKQWRRIERSKEEYRGWWVKNLSKRQMVALIFFPMLSWFLFNLDFRNTCQKPENSIVNNIFKLVKPKAPEWNAQFTKTAKNNQIEVTFWGRLIDNIRYSPQITLKVNNQKYNIDVNSFGDYSHTVQFPMGFDVFEAILTTDNCNKKFTFNNTHKEIQGNQLFINEEIFLLKGIVFSSFEHKSKRSTLEVFRQLKKAGVNLVRVYNPPWSEVINASEQTRMLFIPQPFESNWESSDIESLSRGQGLLGRYKDLVGRYQDNPWSLIFNVGNELEILNRQKVIPRLISLMEEINKEEKGFISMYSSYLTYINYPVDVLGVNMLDTGTTYWNNVPLLLQGLEKPFIASELGGFEAFHEKTDPLLRVVRLKSYWQNLLNVRALGGIIFQSHDNWAQPVPVGYNNPFEAEHPDDNRGIWSNDNKPKFILKTVEDIFHDIQIAIQNDNVFASNTVTLSIQNKRRYSLNNLELRTNTGQTLLIPSLSPQESKQVDLLKSGGLRVATMTYQTHSGIDNIQVHSFEDVNANLPFILNGSNFAIEHQSGTMIAGRMLSKSADIFIPKGWQLVRENGEILFSGRHKIDDFSIFVNPSSITFKKQNANGYYDELTNRFDLNKGVYEVEFSFADPIRNDALLILDGMGSALVRLGAGQNNTRFVETHPYRENIIKILDYRNNKVSDENGAIRFKLNVSRDSITYVDAAELKGNQDIIVYFAEPKIFQPEIITFVKTSSKKTKIQ